MASPSCSDTMRARHWQPKRRHKRSYSHKQLDRVDCHLWWTCHTSLWARHSYCRLGHRGSWFKLLGWTIHLSWGARLDTQSQNMTKTSCRKLRKIGTKNIYVFAFFRPMGKNVWNGRKKGQEVFFYESRSFWNFRWREAKTICFTWYQIWKNQRRSYQKS